MEGMTPDRALALAHLARGNTTTLKARLIILPSGDIRRYPETTMMILSLSRQMHNTTEMSKDHCTSKCLHTTPSTQRPVS